MHRLKGLEGERLRSGALGLGLLMGGAVFSFGHSCGCRKAEILAIKDDGEEVFQLTTQFAKLGSQHCCRCMVGVVCTLEAIPKIESSQ